MRNTGSLRVAVVGGGIIGLSSALELRARGADVAVYESGTQLGAGVTVRAAGMLGAAFEWALEADQRSLAALARHAGMLWPDFAARVERNGGGGFEFSKKAPSSLRATMARSSGWRHWPPPARRGICQCGGCPWQISGATNPH